MRMQGNRNPIRYFLVAGLLVLFNSAVLVQHAWAVRNAENSSVQDLLYQAREEAVGLDNDAEKMEALVQTDVSWYGHADELRTVADRVNRLGAIAAKLQSERENGSPWQQDAIDRIMPMLKEIADNTTNAIKYLDQNKSRPLIGNYPTWLRQNAESAHELAELISDTIKYGQTRSKLEELAQQLKLNDKQ